MDNKKLARLINKVVEYRLEKILTSKNFNEIIKERVNKEVIKLLIEVNRSPQPKRVKTQPTKRSTMGNLSDLMYEEEVQEPRLPRKKFAKNTKINDVMNSTANNRRGMNSFNKANKNQYQTDSIDPMTEYMMGRGDGGGGENGMIQSELAKLGIDPNSVGGMEGLGNDGSEIPTELSKEDMLSEGLDSINIDKAVEVLRQDERYGHLADAFTKDYSGYLTSLEKAATNQRPGLVSRLQPGKPVEF